MREIKLSTDRHDIEDLLRYLDGDHHMSVYDRMRVINDIRAQLNAQQDLPPRTPWLEFTFQPDDSHEHKWTVSTPGGMYDASGVDPLEAVTRLVAVLYDDLVEAQEETLRIRRRFVTEEQA